MKSIPVILLLLSFVSQIAFAQDTIIVQTYTFNDISKRRDTFQFPDKSVEFSKILMYYTLKCDPKTPHDKYNCGEWDYETTNYIYDHNATYDSTYKSADYFITGHNAAPANLPATLNQAYQYILRPSYSVSYDSIYTYNLSSPGTHLKDVSSSFFSSGHKTQIIWTANDLVNAGLDSGYIYGIKFYNKYPVNEDLYLALNAGNTLLDSFEKSKITLNTTDNYFAGELSVSDTGWIDIRFTQPYVWDGKSNLLIEIETWSHKGSLPVIAGGSPTSNSMTAIAGGENYSMHFAGNNDMIQINAYNELTGNQARTIELWAKTDQFNNGGLFQAGTQSSSRDFSLRTTTTDNKWRIQLWGSDIDITLPDSKNKWHHYALVYTGSKVILYYDGGKIKEKSVALNTGLAAFKIGRWNGSYFKGNIDELRIWDKALTQNEVRNWMYSPVSTTHPSYTNLIGYFPMDEGNGNKIIDQSGKNKNGQVNGNTWWQPYPANEQFFKLQTLYTRPDVQFEQGNILVSVDTNTFKDSIPLLPQRIFLRNNPSSPHIIADNADYHPSEYTDTVVVWPGNAWLYSTTENGDVMDSTWVAADSLFYNKKLVWYSSTVTYEIGRFITPYGINLDLGKEGFRWIYDVTDYRDLLSGAVDFKAGNLQELLDVKFVMIKGKPARKVVNIQQLWNQGRASYSYANLDNDVNCAPLKVKLSPDASTFKIRSRLSGHGHNSNDGNYPHCCEWKDNTHYFYADGNRIQDWHIWREDCKMNPVFPQGGTWNGSREGWCPGDVVPEHNFDITDHVKSGDSVLLDYRITPVPSNNKGMGNGRYLTSFQLMEYADAAYNTDAGVYDIKRPSDNQLYSRQNPVCNEPVVVLRNGGKNDLTALDIDYYVTPGQKLSYHWTGTLKFMETEEVTLPVSSENFWKTSSESRFHVEISNPNGKTDENALNDQFISKFNIPDIYDDNFVIWFRTNNVPDENSWIIKDIKGNVVYSRDNLSANTTYRDTLDLPKGCYTFELFDEGYGLSYWAWPDQGTGYIKFRGKDGKSLKVFEPDFGEKIFYAFTIGFSLDIKEDNLNLQASLYPNPASDVLNVNLYGMEGNYNLEIVNMMGQLVFEKQINSQGVWNGYVDLENMSTGLYYLVIRNGSEKITRMFQKK